MQVLELLVVGFAGLDLHGEELLRAPAPAEFPDRDVRWPVELDPARFPGLHHRPRRDAEGVGDFDPVRLRFDAVVRTGCDVDPVEPNRYFLGGYPRSDLAVLF